MNSLIKNTYLLWIKFWTKIKFNHLYLQRIFDNFPFKKKKKILTTIIYNIISQHINWTAAILRQLRYIKWVNKVSKWFNVEWKKKNTLMMIMMMNKKSVWHLWVCNNCDNTCFFVYLNFRCVTLCMYRGMWMVYVCIQSNFKVLEWQWDGLLMFWEIYLWNFVFFLSFFLCLLVE